MAVKKEIVNWTWQGKEIKDIAELPKNCIGIIYKITNLTNNRYYFGRKTILSRRKKKLTLREKELPENKRKTFKYEETETYGWKNYCGSNKILLQDIKNGDKYFKEIIHICYSKAELTFFETRAIVCSECMLTEDCYNDWFSSKVYKSHLMKK